MGNWTFEFTIRNENGNVETIYKYFNRKPGSARLADILSRHGHVLNFRGPYRSR